MRRLLFAAAVVVLALVLAGTTGRAATSSTVVTIQFDDGSADQYAALAMLNAHGMHATFYVNTGFTGDATHLSWTQLSDLHAAGNEIAGHTLTHAHLKHLKTADARHEVCDDRVNLYNHGLEPTSFAYPFGEFDAGVKQIVRDCGYNSGRGVPGVDDRKTFAETIPPLDAYATRTPPNPKQGTTLATIESYVTGAEQHGGGWVQLVFHHLCDGCDAYSISPATFTALLDWLQPRAASGTVVETTAQVICGRVPSSGLLPPGATASTSLEPSNQWQWSASSANQPFSWKLIRRDGVVVASGSSPGPGGSIFVPFNDYRWQVTNNGFVGQYWPRVCWSPGP